MKGVVFTFIQVPKNKMKNREYTGNTKFIKWDFGDYEEMSIRIVRFKITDTTYETIFTSLPIDKFSLEDIKALCGMRWGIIAEMLLNIDFSDEGNTSVYLCCPDLGKMYISTIKINGIM